MSPRCRRSEFPCRHSPLRRAVARGLLIVFGAALPGAPPPAWAGIAGEQVMSGEASFQHQGDVTTIHASDGAIIHYDQFSVGANEQLRFVQPSDQARVLNRVFGDATRIDGGLFANGIVYILNPAGVFFGGQALIDVGGLVAAAGHLSDADFLAGVDRFELTGVVQNEGRIEAPSVALLGRAVANHGSIRAPDGTIALVAGERVLLAQLGGHLLVQVEGRAGDAGVPAIEQTGTVEAGAGSVSFTTGDVYSLALNHDGITRGRAIELRAESGLVQVSGELDASDARAGATGGSIAVTGEKVALLGADLDASGDAGGGDIRVGGDLRGAGALPNARRTFVDADSALKADAISAGDGGRVIVWADEATAFGGSLSARGGAAGGDGGFAEISGAVFLTTDGDVDLGAPAGATGTLLYDPQDIEIRGGTDDGSDAPDAQDDRLDDGTLGQVLFGDVGDEPFRIFESEIEETDANIVLEAENSITATGAFDHDAAGEGTGVLRIADTRSLVMRTRNDPGDETGGAAAPGIDLAGVSLETSGGGGITLATGAGAEASVDADIDVGDLTARGADGATGGAGGSITLSTDRGDVTAGAIDASGGEGTAGNGGAGGAVSIRTVDGAIAVASVNTSGGEGSAAGGAAGRIELIAGDADAARNSDVAVNGDLRAIGGEGSGGAGGAGGVVQIAANGVLKDPFPDDDNTPAQVITGGGDISVEDVITRGGDGTANGGRGGNVRIETSDGQIDAGNLDASGGDGDDSGGSAGTLTMLGRDANHDNASAIDVGDLLAAGGNGETGAGGSGAFIDVRTQPSARVVETRPPGSTDPENVLQEAEGGGSITTGDIDTSGGNGATNGGNAGQASPFDGTSVRIAASGDGRVVTVGTVDAQGGNAGSGNHGSGRDVLLSTEEDGGNVEFVNIDASEGSGGTDTASGGAVTIRAGDHIVHGAPITGGAADGSHIAAGDAVELTAGGDASRGGAPLAIRGGGGEETGLFVTTGGQAHIEVTNRGFLGVISAIATSLDADIDIDQDGGDSIRMSQAGSRMRVTEADATGNDVRMEVAFANPDEMAADGTLELATGSVRTADLFRARSDGDIVVGTGGGTVIDAAEDGTVLVIADFDGDGSDSGDGGDDGGAILDGGGAIALDGADLTLHGGAGIGTQADPIAISGGGTITAANQPRKENPDTSPTASPFIRDPGASSGVFVANGGSGDLEIASAQVDAGDGAIGIANTAGDIVANGVIRTKPISADDGTGGDIRLEADRIVLDTAIAIASGGEQTYDGDVALRRVTRIEADGGVEVSGVLGTSEDAPSDAALTVTLGDEATDVSTFAVGGGIGAGASRPLGSLTLAVPDGGEIALDTPSIRTSGAQSYGSDLDFDQDTDLSAGGAVSFAGDVTGAGLVVSTPALIAFSGAGDQSVETAGDLALNPAGRTAIPSEATIAKASGNLTLESTGGSVIVGDGEKVSAAGQLDITGDTVRVTDLSALDISITSPDAQVFAREPGLVTAANGGLLADGGTDLLGTTVSFSTSPTVVGGGPAPRIATLSGVAENPGAISVAKLPVPIAPADIARGALVFDLTIPTSDPGHETPYPGDLVVPLLQPEPSQERAGPSAPVSAEEVIAYFACAPLGDESAPAGCAAIARPAYGSALDTERASEVAQDYRALLGDSESASAGRAALAEAAADPRTSLASVADPAGRAYLAELARVLVQTRIMGIGEVRYREVRADMLAAVVAAVGSPQLDAQRLGTAAQAYAAGVEI